VIKFGKKVNYETKDTNNQVMEEHLKQMREKMQVSDFHKDIKRQEEL
jgi:hypothetical protein